MYRGSNERVAYSEAKDFSVALYLRDPKYVAKNQSRRYYNESVAHNNVFSRTWSNWRLIDVCGLVVHTYPDGTPRGNVRIRLVSGAYGVLVDKTVPYSTTFGFSLTDMPQTVLSHVNNLDNLTFSVYNYTGVPIYLCYITTGPLMFYNSANGLVSASFGETMGNDEYLPEFGVSHMYGSFEVQDKRRTLLGLLTSPSSYGVDSALARYSLRCEAFVGTQLAGVYAVDEFAFAEDNKRVSVTLKSVLMELDSIPGLGPRVAYMSASRTLADALTEFFSHVKSQYSDVLGQFDFGGVTGNAIMATYNVTGPLALQGNTTVLGFLEKVCQAIGCVIGVRHVLNTSMQYAFSVYGWTEADTGSEQALGWPIYQYSYLEPKDVVGEVQYTPVVKNHIDKITYTKYEVEVSEQERELSVDYELVDMKGYASARDDKNAFKAYWEAKSPSTGLPQNNAKETTFGMRIPRPGDITYDGQHGKYVCDYDNLEKSEARALTRGFLWRFLFATSFKNSRFSTTSVANVLATMESMAVYGGNGLYNSSYMMTRRGTTIKPTTARSFSYCKPDGTVQTVNVNLAGVGCTFWSGTLFDYMPSWYKLHLKIPAGYYLVDGQTYNVSQYFSYWFSPIYGFNPWTKGGDWPDTDRAWTPLPFGGNNIYIYHANNMPQDWSGSFKKISDYMTMRLSANQFTAYHHTDGAIAPGGHYPYKRDVPMVFNTYDYYDPYVGTIKQVGCCNDIDGGYGAPWGCMNLNDNQHSGENTIWPAYDPSGLPDNRHWFHSGFEGDSTARGDASLIKVATTNVSVSAILGHATAQDQEGNFYVQWALPSSDTLKAAIVGSDDNFLNKPWKTNSSWVGEEDESPGSTLSQQANAYCTFWSVPCAGSIMGMTAMIYKSTDPDTDLGWRMPRPSYGYCVKGVRYAISGRFLEISEGGTVSVQFNNQNQYNYDLATNELMTERLVKAMVGNPTCIDYLLTQLHNAFENGKTVYWVKARVRGLCQGYTSTAAPFVRNPYLRDVVYGVNVARNGQQTNVVKATSARVRAIEYVMENGECYANLRLMDV